MGRTKIALAKVHFDKTRICDIKAASSKWTFYLYTNCIAILLFLSSFDSRELTFHTFETVKPNCFLNILGRNQMIHE